MAAIAPLNCGITLEETVANYGLRSGLAVLGTALILVALWSFGRNSSEEHTREALDIEDLQEDPPDRIEGGDLIDLFTHWDSSFWDASNFFLAFQSLLIAGTGLIISVQSHPFQQLRASGMAGFPILGILVSAFWLLVMHRKRTYVEATEARIKNRDPTLDGEIRREQDGLASLSSAQIVTAILPLTFLLFWFAFLVFAICNVSP